MVLLDGKKTANDIKDELAVEVLKIKAEGGKVPHLAAIIVGENGASITYVNAKVKACEKVGFGSSLIQLKLETTQEELLAKIEELNNDDVVDGFIVQLPLPDHIDEETVLNAVSPTKDVDGFHPANFGKVALGLPSFIPATPNGILELLKRYEVETSGKHCVVVGRSNIVGLPMSILMGQNRYPGNCTVTLTHSRTKNLEEITKSADILIVALGKPEFITGDMVKEGVTIIDVGITRVKDETKKSGFRLLGDVHFESVAPKSEFITPVPGGVGPMTIASLMQNTLKAIELNK
ncbi:MAG: methylenetetrahydrofolate dehydrogenase (NADP+)/methenyltetrahydrofolate cyclohydrolase [Salibacteraceae bacterium]|jgi:methylenetetrahydrofolate dehydrogenase (NADP+)/methenyltetrahydrofolate cyclohydrolase